MDVKFWGVRGSFPALGFEYTRYGGDTSCVTMDCAGKMLVFDAGSGLVRLGKTIKGPVDIDIFLSHVHLDHVMGLAYFAPLYHPGSRIRIWLEQRIAGLHRKAIRGLFGPPLHPVKLEKAPAKLEWRTYRAGARFSPRSGVKMIAHPLPHPGGAMGFRVEHGGQTAVYGVDSGALHGAARIAAVDWGANADLLILDATFTCAESEKLPDWGHMSWKEAVEFGIEAQAKRICLFHHGPDRVDDALDAIATDARALSSKAFLAREGMTMVLDRARAEVPA
mgnify:CR=1 FL=1